MELLTSPADGRRFLRAVAFMRLLFPLFLLFFLLLLLLLLACSDRERLNPLDPLNPGTGGVPWNLRVIAGDQRVDLSWSTFVFDDLASFRIDRAVGTGSDSAIALVGSRFDRFTDFAVDNGIDYTYRLVPLLEDGRPVATDGPIRATPGPQSAWVADTGGFQVAKLSPDGRAAVFRLAGFRAPNAVSVSASDGRVWVADSFNRRVVALDRAGEVVRVIGGFSVPKAVSASPVDGSVWVADESAGEVIHLAADGTELGRVTGLASPTDVAANPADGSAWAAVTGSGEVLRIAADGSILAGAGGFIEPLQIAAVHADTACWVADDDLNQVVRLDRDGRVEARITLVLRPFGLAVEQSSGSIWVGSFANGTIELFAGDGRPTGLTIQGFAGPLGIALDPFDETLWVVDSQRDQVAKVTRSGVEIGRTGGFLTPFDIDIDPGTAPTGERRAMPADPVPLDSEASLR